jgi:hypothetical protein
MESHSKSERGPCALKLSRDAHGRALHLFAKSCYAQSFADVVLGALPRVGGAWIEGPLWKFF